MIPPTGQEGEKTNKQKKPGRAAGGGGGVGRQAGNPEDFQASQ